jgi:hypothetical protein
MRTAIIRKIDDHIVILNFDVLARDPEATKTAVKFAADGNDTIKNLRDRIKVAIDKIHLIRVAMSDLHKEAFKVKMSNLPDKDLILKRLETKFIAKAEKVDELKQVIIDHNKQMRVIIDKLVISNTVYCEPSGKEISLTEEDYQELHAKFSSLKSDEKLAATGEIIIDKRHIEWTKKVNGIWTKGIISKLGEDLPTDSKLVTELTNEEQEEVRKQLETKRIANMTDSEKAEELGGMTESLLNQAAIMKSRLELKEDSAALSKAKAWLQSERTKLEAKYA